MNRTLLRDIIDDGQRAYRLRKSISACPNFDNPLHKKAWKAGYKSALHKISVEATLVTFIKENLLTTPTESCNLLN